MREVASLVLQPLSFGQNSVSNFDITFSLLDLLNFSVKLSNLAFYFALGPFLGGRRLFLSTGEAKVAHLGFVVFWLMSSFKL